MACYRRKNYGALPPAMIQSAFSLSLPLIVAGKGKGPQGISFQRKLAAVLGEGRTMCLG